MGFISIVCDLPELVLLLLLAESDYGKNTGNVSCYKQRNSLSYYVDYIVMNLRVLIGSVWNIRRLYYHSRKPIDQNGPGFRSGHQWVRRSTRKLFLEQGIITRILRQLDLFHGLL